MRMMGKAMAEVVSFRKDQAGKAETVPLNVSRKDAVLRLTLNNPPANVLSISLMRALREALDAAEVDDDVRFIVLSATGNVFSAGHDLKEMTRHRDDADAGAPSSRKPSRFAPI